jgi:hypothetical protein
MTFIWFKIKFNCFEFRSYCFISSTFNLLIDSYYFYLNMPRKTRHLIVEGEKTGDGISYASHVKNPNPLKARATTFYDPVHNALDKEAQCAWKEGEGSHWPSVYIQKPFMTL